MSTPVTKVCKDKAVRLIRDSNDKIIEIRVFGLKAKIGDVCKVTTIVRDPTSFKALSIVSGQGRVDSGDLGIL